ncbi:hypothetical protein CGK14_23585 [Vibrio parahaemolyticus]|nr:hypothetical protein CGK14_23585 [Vibrio parahaemolyticus]HDY7974307.1 DUF3265 domain-containing protein [Vibrio vulnificus]HDY8082877.1 DUF3265 domain-containing protein [Vibrio vulnificus]
MRNAWRFHYALILVIEVVCGNIVLRCSPLKRALNIHCDSDVIKLRCVNVQKNISVSVDSVANISVRKVECY